MLLDLFNKKSINKEDLVLIPDGEVVCSAFCGDNAVYIKDNEKGVFVSKSNIQKVQEGDKVEYYTKSKYKPLSMQELFLKDEIYMSASRPVAIICSSETLQFNKEFKAVSELIAVRENLDFEEYVDLRHMVYLKVAESLISKDRNVVQIVQDVDSLKYFVINVPFEANKEDVKKVYFAQTGHQVEFVEDLFLNPYFNNCLPVSKKNDIQKTLNL